jgi:hypothetical protein
MNKYSVTAAALCIGSMITGPAAHARAAGDEACETRAAAAVPRKELDVKVFEQCGSLAGITRHECVFALLPHDSRKPGKVR